MKYINTFKRNLTSIFLSFGILFLIYSCDQYGGPNVPQNAGKAPQSVSITNVNNIPGGAQIFYKLPKDKNLRHVKAVFSTKTGGRKTVLAGKFKDSLTVRGFSDTSAHKVRLFAVGSGEVLSEPDSVTVHPLTPPFEKVYKSINLKSAPGGINVSFRGNDNESKLAVVIVQDTVGEILPITTFYSSAKEDTSAITGLQNETYKLGYYVRDQFQNRSDTTFANILPLILYDRSDWTIDDFDSQQVPAAFGLPPFPASRILDGDESTPWVTEFSPQIPPLPHYVSVDMGESHEIHGLQIVGSRTYDYQNPAKIAIQVSKDGRNWSNREIFNTGFKVGGKLRGNFNFKSPKQGQYFKVIILKDTQSPAPSNFAEVYAF